VPPGFDRAIPVRTAGSPAAATAAISPLPLTVSPHPFTGTLTIDVPLAMPAKGSAMPRLTLVYDSQRQETTAGIGWTLAAGSIARGRKRGIDYAGRDFVLTLGSTSVEPVNVFADGARA